MPTAKSRCRHCGAELNQTLVDLGSSPLCNSLVDEANLQAGESFYPLHVRICGVCFLAQLDEFVSPAEIFSEYSYFSSFSDSFVAHAKAYADMAIRRFNLTPASKVVEVASNDGYLLQHFVARNIPVLGIEPALNVAAEARHKGVPTVSHFLGAETGQAIRNEHGAADLVAANNVLAHTPYLNEFVIGLRHLIRDTGVVTVEFPHLIPLIENNLFDTIYHEHFSYFSLFSVERVFATNSLRVFDVEVLDTHGGSLRVFAEPSDAAPARELSPAITARRAAEAAFGIDKLTTYSRYSEQVERTKRELLTCLIGLRNAGKRIVGYGAPGKGNTLLNYCGIRTDFLDYMVDRNPYKQGKYTPGTRIPIHSPDKIRLTRPDFILIMPWNLKSEIIGQLGYVREWGARFIVPLPVVTILD
ncbi:MAG: class I SAM-dependent methyltransferase [Gammaproteobacteria bacterium]|nr:class I SAM-dependent methyltransferase [Gammaproteobacteria bacterium]